jgi:anti-sigma B factor antagonist
MDVEPVRIRQLGDGTLEITLHGDIDFGNATAVRERIRTTLAETHPTTVRVDLGEVPFLDSSGMAVLVVAHRLATSMGAGYAVVGPNRAVYEHLRLTGLAGLFGVAEPESAGSAAGPDAG